MSTSTEQSQPIVDTPRRIGVTRTVIIVVLLWFGLVAIWEWLAPPHDSTVTLCLFKRETGLPCPTCGSTRAVKSLFHADVARAFLFNPLLVIVLVMIIAWLIARLAIGRERMAAFMMRNHRVIPAGLILGLLLNWVYLLIRHWNGAM